MQAFLIEHDANAVEFMGNRTECALLMLLRGWGLRYEAVRNEHKAQIFQVYNFSSERKMASVLLRQGNGLRLYNKVSFPDVLISNPFILHELISNPAEQYCCFALIVGWPSRLRSVRSKHVPHAGLCITSAALEEQSSVLPPALFLQAVCHVRLSQ